MRLHIGSDAALTAAITPQLIAEEGTLIAMEIVITVLLLKNNKERIIEVWNNRWSGDTIQNKR